MTTPTAPRLAIVTFPFLGNYGGMLQAYALQEVLTRLGFNVRLAEAQESALLGTASRAYIKRQLFLGRIFRKLGLRMKGEQFRATMLPMVQSFTSRFMHLRRLASAAPAEWARYFAETDVCVVGSDQVWRKLYTLGNGGLPLYFLKHAPADVRARSISYAASFGTEEWEGSPEQTEECTALLRDFRAVSVREHSGVDLCRQALGRTDAVQMPDPTLLAAEEDYARLIEADVREVGTLPLRPYLVDYILDSSRGKRAIIAAALAAGMEETRALAYTRYGRADGALQPYSVGEWLHAIRGAKLMVTDSFHGCVFSIIFNTPFICIPNGKRGISRFESLLRTFGLEDRLLPADSAPAEITRLASAPIDWEKVNAHRAAERERGLRFLRENLSSSCFC